VKLVVSGAHSLPFAQFYDEHPDANWVISALMRLEVIRAVHRGAPEVISDARDLLDAVSYVRIDDDVINAAMNVTDRMLRSLDAIHLATARLLGTEPNAMATYDSRLAVAASAVGMTIVDPRDRV
jgi:hypothetical protein